MPINPDLDRVLRDLLRPGMRVFVHAGPAESIALNQTLAANPELAAGIEFTGVLLPGINNFDYAGLSPTTAMTTIFVPSCVRESFEAGRHRVLPIHYSALTTYFEAHPVDLAILHCPPDRSGEFSFGVNADVAGTVAARAGRRLMIVNHGLPWTRGDESLKGRETDLFIEDDCPPINLASDPADAVAHAISDNAASLVNDGDTVQIGIGRIPTAILTRLRGRRRLKLHTGIVTDEVAGLVSGGEIDLNDNAPIVSGSAGGTQLIRDLVSDHRVRICSARVTHDVGRIGNIAFFIALNSALEVDLFGQVNGEAVRGRRISGVGGANDFARGAQLGRGGRSVIAMPASAGRHSRIIPVLAPGTVSQAAADADIVVTEYGIARLRHLSMDDRAAALIEIAAPDHRQHLAETWRAARANL